MLTTLIIIIKMGGCFLMGDDSPAAGLHAPWVASFFLPTSLDLLRPGFLAGLLGRLSEGSE